jgi:hypothetical protein
MIIDISLVIIHIDVKIDGDNIEHIQWIVERATQRADAHKITGINFRFTQGVVKRVIPAVASTNAVIASICATEVFKLATSYVRLLSTDTRCFSHMFLVLCLSHALIDLSC